MASDDSTSSQEDKEDKKQRKKAKKAKKQKKQKKAKRERLTAHAASPPRSTTSKTIEQALRHTRPVVVVPQTGGAAGQHIRESQRITLATQWTRMRPNEKPHLPNFQPIGRAN